MIQYMRGLVLIAVSIVSAQAVTAQPSPVHLFVDYPVQGRTYRAEGFYIGGWTLNCYTGQQPPVVDVFYSPDIDQSTGLYPPVVRVRDAVIHWRLLRPDVKAAAPSLCRLNVMPHVTAPSSPYLGFAITFQTPLPIGSRVVVVRVVDPVFQPTTDPSLGAKYWQAMVNLTP